MSQELIRVVQLPVIEEQLRAVKETVAKRTEEAIALICTEDTIQTVKKVRAELKKEFAELEENRKAVKKAVLTPYESFEAVYKDCISEAFKVADAELKRKIDSVETEIKERCEEVCRKYYFDKCVSLNISGFAPFERMNLQIGLADAKQKTQPPNKLREQMDGFCESVYKSLSLIAEGEFAEEVLVEYEKSLDYATAISTVRERHKRQEEKLREMEERKERIAQQEDMKVSTEQESIIYLDVEGITFEDREPEPAEETVRCSFTVEATITQLKELKAFMQEHNIKEVN